MIDGKYDYFAFISYRWEDEKMARWLQEKLEHYKLPTSLREQNPDLPAHIRPIFRDKTDLNGHTLEESLMSALESSRYLIVVCSPLATQSDWVNRGIQKFIDLGREKDIIPFIVDGEANADDPKNECFPPALRSLKSERAIYGININDNGREAAAVKVVSRMFDVKYDTLWNRFLLEQKKRRRYIIAGLVAAILVVAGVAGHIWTQNQELGRKNHQIQEQKAEIIKERDAAIREKNRAEEFSYRLTLAYDSITRQEYALHKAYGDLANTEEALVLSNSDLKLKNLQLTESKDSLQKTQCRLFESNEELTQTNERLANEINNVFIARNRFINEKAKQQIDEGDVYGAMLPLVEIVDNNRYHENIEEETEPVLRYALSKTDLELDIDSFCNYYEPPSWLSNVNFQCMSRQKMHDKKITYLSTMSGNRIISSSEDGVICVWNADNGELQNKYTNINPIINHNAGNDYCIIDYHRLFDINTGKYIPPARYKGKQLLPFMISKDGKYVYFYDDRCYIVQAKYPNWEITRVLPNILGDPNDYKFLLSPNGRYALLMGEFSQKLWDIADNTTKQFNIKGANISNLCWVNGTDSIIIDCGEDRIICGVSDLKIDIPIKKFCYRDRGSDETTLSVSSQNQNILSYVFTPGLYREIIVSTIAGGKFSTIPWPYPHITQAAFSSNDQYIFTGDAEGNIRIWEKTNKQKRYFGDIGMTDFIPDNNLKYGVSTKGKNVFVWNLTQKSAPFTFPIRDRYVNHLQIVGDERFCISTDKSIYTYDKNGNVLNSFTYNNMEPYRFKLWKNGKNERFAGLFINTLYGHYKDYHLLLKVKSKDSFVDLNYSSERINNIDICSGGDYVLVNSADSITIRSILTGKSICRYIINKHDQAIFLNDSTFATMEHYGRRICLYNLHNSSSLPYKSIDSAISLDNISVDKTGKYLLLTGRDNSSWETQIMVYSLKTYNIIASYNCPIAHNATMTEDSKIITDTGYVFDFLFGKSLYEQCKVLLKGRKLQNNERSAYHL